jgi:hypothetical protein
MATIARLQKEIRMLASDPAPGFVSFHCVIGRRTKK